MSSEIKQRVFKLVSDVLMVSIDKIHEDLTVEDIPEWDSLGHVSIISRVESEFNITLDMDQALDIESIEDIIDILDEMNLT